MIDHDRIAEVYEGTVGSREFQQVTRRRIHWMCAQVAGEDVVDVGCSQGIASILLGREGHRVVGIDREHEAIRAARERLDQEEPEVRDRVEFRIGEARALPYPDESFDAVLLGEILEHQLDPGRPLDEARRVLRPDGRIVITTPYGIHPYPDHKEVLYLSALLEELDPKLSIAAITLVDRYLGVVAELSKDQAPRVWRRALKVAEHRLADQDEALETMRGLVGELREGTRALERAQQDQDLTTKSVEIQRDAAVQRQAELQTRLAEVEERAATAAAARDSALRDLEEAREQLRTAERERTVATDRAHQLEADERAAARELERMHSEVRGVRERLHRIEVGHRSAVADLERAQAEKTAADTELQAARAELDQARAATLELERQLAERTAELAERTADAEGRLAERIAELEGLLAERDAALAEALRESERIQNATALEAERIRADTARVVERAEEDRLAAVEELERLEAQQGVGRARLTEARARIAELLAARHAAEEATAAVTRRAEEAEAALARLRDQAEAKTREAAEQAETLRTELDGLRTTIESLTSEGAALRRALREVESGLEKERRQKEDLETRLAGSRAYTEQLAQELAEIQGRLGYRMGHFMRRLTFRGVSPRQDDEEDAHTS